MKLNHHDVVNVPAPQLAVIVIRGVLAVTLPAILFSALAGLCRCRGSGFQLFYLGDMRVSYQKKRFVGRGLAKMYDEPEPVPKKRERRWKLPKTKNKIKKARVK
jgi:hypothetical protein